MDCAELFSYCHSCVPDTVWRKMSVRGGEEILKGLVGVWCAVRGFMLLAAFSSLIFLLLFHLPQREIESQRTNVCWRLLLASPFHPPSPRQQLRTKPFDLLRVLHYTDEFFSRIFLSLPLSLTRICRLTFTTTTYSKRSPLVLPATGPAKDRRSIKR